MIWMLIACFIVADTQAQWREVEVGSLTRTYLYHLPADVEPDATLPVVLVFHGGLSNAEQMMDMTGMNDAADRFGFVAVYPQGTGRIENKNTWNGGNCCGYAQRRNIDDVAFVEALIDDLAATESIDTQRVYATGMSNGAIFSYRLADELSDRIAAIAPIAGPMGNQTCDPTRAVPVIHFHGTDDQFAPFDGGIGAKSVSRTDFLSIEYTLKQWIEANGCDEVAAVEALPDEHDDDTTVTRTTYAGEAPVVLITIHGGGHTWPGHTPRLRWLGTTTQEIDANAVMWRFFERFALP